ncbi:sigma-E factor negative regulatory protein [Variovorax sp. YR752]|uniref:sigma-E factor negative regulatory protein n=1 Tax=Variovorax sp. YR752 TaxID=1884383 RepID=UPI003137AB69
MSSEQSMGSNGAEDLSALADGELASEGVRRACAAWRSDGNARQTWHAYQLIGDVLRSDDLASSPSRDEAFLRRLRERLADEPVVLAPQVAPAAAAPMATGRRLRRWHAGAAVAAGFVAVAGVLVVTRGPAPQAGPGALAAAPAPVVPVAVNADAGVEPAALVTDGKVIRDARLDRYLAAHQNFAGASALGVPSAFLRSATTDASMR